MRPDHATNSSRLGVTVVVTAAESYDVLVGGAVLYPMGFQMDYWTKTLLIDLVSSLGMDE
jgi:hypothetical protein